MKRIVQFAAITAALGTSGMPQISFAKGETVTCEACIRVEMGDKSVIKCKLIKCDDVPSGIIANAVPGQACFVRRVGGPMARGVITPAHSCGAKIPRSKL